MKKDAGAETECNESNVNDGRMDVTILSLDESSNVAPSNGAASSLHVNATSDVGHGDNIPTRKTKINSDSWKNIKRIKNEDLLTRNKDGMTHSCAKCCAMIKFSKDEKKGMWLIARAL